VHGDRQRLLDTKGARRDPFGKRPALDVFEDEGPDTARFFRSVNLGDIAVVQGGQNLRFALEPVETVRLVSDQIRQELQGDIPVEPRVPGPIHLAPCRLCR
jgi:hypothetical protein